MVSKVMTLNDAEIVVAFPEISMVFIGSSWLCFTDIELDALAYLVKNSHRIILPNVKKLTKEQKALLKNYTGFLDIGDKSILSIER